MFDLKGYVATTVQQYLAQFPLDEQDVVHVEDGGWVNPDGDFGSPQSLKWNWPLIPNNAQVCGHSANVCGGIWDLRLSKSTL